MNQEPYFCPNCRSNRVKFSIITTHSQNFLKDAINGSIMDITNEVIVPVNEPEIQCRVCSFIGNEMRFLKQAAREPRT